MNFLLTLVEILLLFVAGYLVASVVWKVFAILGLVSLSVVLTKDFLFAFLIMLFMFLLRETSLFARGVIIVGCYILLVVLGVLSPGNLSIKLF
jgi:formate-dependent nitrite reductase membrane component NrfD